MPNTVYGEKSTKTFAKQKSNPSQTETEKAIKSVMRDYKPLMDFLGNKND